MREKLAKVLFSLRCLYSNTSRKLDIFDRVKNELTCPVGCSRTPSH